MLTPWRFDWTEAEELEKIRIAKEVLEINKGLGLSARFNGKDPFKARVEGGLGELGFEKLLRAQSVPFRAAEPILRSHSAMRRQQDFIVKGHQFGVKTVASENPYATMKWGHFLYPAKCDPSVAKKKMLGYPDFLVAVAVHVVKRVGWVIGAVEKKVIERSPTKEIHSSNAHLVPFDKFESAESVIQKIEERAMTQLPLIPSHLPNWPKGQSPYRVTCPECWGGVTASGCVWYYRDGREYLESCYECGEHNRMKGITRFRAPKVELPKPDPDDPIVKKACDLFNGEVVNAR